MRDFIDGRFYRREVLRESLEKRGFRERYFREETFYKREIL